MCVRVYTFVYVLQLYVVRVICFMCLSTREQIDFENHTFFNETRFHLLIGYLEFFIEKKFPSNIDILRMEKPIDLFF